LNLTEVFISHASEDKDSFVRPFAGALILHPGVNVFYDEYSLMVGNSLLQSVSKGLRECHYGIVVFSPNSIAKKWPQDELAGLLARETTERKIILPVWHNLGLEEMLEYYPIFADRIAAKSIHGVDRIVSDILRSIQASQRTKEVIVPIMGKLESLVNKASVRQRSDQLRKSQQGVNLVLEEAQRLFNLFESYFDPTKENLGLK
jgi:hypothetical protein